MRSLFWTTTLVLIACGPAPQTKAVQTQAPLPAPTATTTPPQPGGAPTAVIERRVTAPQPQVAGALASNELATALVGAHWAGLLQVSPLFGTDWASWVMTNRVVRPAQESGQYVASMSSAQVALVLAEFERLGLPRRGLRAPATWQPTVFAALEAEWRWMLCTQRQQWLGTPCAASAPIDERLAVNRLLSGIELQPVLREGIPTRNTSGALLSAVEVRAQQQSNGQVSPLPGLPLVVQPSTRSAASVVGSDAPTTPAAVAVDTDERGIARFAVENLPDSVVVRVALDAALGPLAPLVESPEVTVATRPLELRRTIVIEAAEPVAEHRLAHLLERELATALQASPKTLTTTLRRELLQETAQKSGPVLLSEGARQHLVDATQGTADYLLVVSGNSEYASQMGADRIWYEARARATLIEIWSGTVVSEIEEKAMGAGIGDAAADAAARSTVSHQLARRVEALQSVIDH